MCLIYLKPEGLKLNKKAFKTAVLNNSDGFGVSVPDGKGSLTTIRDASKTDANALYNLIHKDFENAQALIHLRYTTVGDTILRNAHPFPILEKSKDGVDVRMAHNGTLNLYKPAYNENSNESDTRRFVTNFVRPLFKRLIKGMSSKEIFEDKWLNMLIDRELSAASVVTFIDGYGNTMIVNGKGNGGKLEANGLYYSNVYSFDPEHRVPFHQRKKAGGSSTGTKMGPPKTPTNTPTTTGGTSHFKGHGAASITQLEKDFALDTKTERFSERFSIPVENFVDMSDEFIDRVVEDDPTASKLLVKECLEQIWLLTEMLDEAEKNAKKSA